MSLMKYATGKYNYVPIRPLGDISRKNFNGQIEVQMTVPQGKHWDPSNSYFSIKAAFFGYTGAGVKALISDNALNTTADITDNLALSSDPCACLFQKLAYYCNDKHISTVENVAQVDQIKNMVFESKSTIEKALSTNPIYWQSGAKPALVTAIGDIVDPYAAQTPAQAVRIAAQNSPFYYSSENRMVWRPPIPVLQLSEPFPENSRHKFVFNVDPQWQRKTVSGYHTNGTPAIVSWAIQYSSDTAANNAVVFEITDFIFYAAFYDSNIRLPKQINYIFPEIYSAIKPVQNAVQDRFSFTVPRGTYKILLGFIDARNGTDTRYSPTNFSVDTLRAQLSDISLTYAGESFPLKPYSFPTANFLNTWNTATTDTQELANMYYEMLLGSDAFRDSSSTSLNFRDWLINPLWVFKIVKPPGDLSSNLDVYLKFRNGPGTDVSCFIMALYNSEVSIKLNDSGLIEDIETEQLI